MKQCSFLSRLGGAISIFCLVTISPVQAQIASDGTLGTIVNNPSGNIFEIIGGTPAGSNLFHSFDQFSVPNGDVVRFINNNLNIQNVISRVTGHGSVYISNINGVIAADGTSPNFNLFLLNPNGILFGSNAQLNIGGSFVATTADAIQFGNQRFIASTSQNDVSLMTVNPSALLFNQIAANSITSQARLQVANSQSLLLVGGNVSLDGGVLNAPGGRVELGSIAGVGTIDLTVDGNDLYLNSFPDSIARADVSLLNGANVDVVSSGGGSIAIYARNLDVFTGGTALSAGIGSGLGSPSAQAGDITLNATGAFRIGRSSFITNEVRRLGIGDSGDIKIYSGSFSLIEDARLVASTSGQGQAGNVLIEAANSVSFVTGAIFSNVEAGGAGNGGNITINAKSLSLTDGAELQTVLREASDTLSGGQGKAGNVNIYVQDTVTIAGVNFRGFISKVFTEVNPGAVGDGGDINITARSVYLLDGAGLTTRTQSRGNAGIIRINATDVVEISGVNARSNARTSLSTNTTTDGKGGDILINTKILTILNGAGVFADTSGAGRAGTLAVNANSVEVIGTSPNGQSVSGLYFDTSSGGNAGELKITTGRLIIRDGGRVSASTSDQGQAGILAVQADLVEVSGTSADGQNPSRLFFDSSSAGNAGELRIDTGQLIVSAGGQVSATASGTGGAGTLTVNARDSVEVSGTGYGQIPTYLEKLIDAFGYGQFPSGLYFDTSGSGDAGVLRVDTGRLLIQEGGRISASTSGTGQGGNLVVNVSDSVVVSGKNGQFASGLYFDSRSAGNARGISINTGRLDVQNGGQVTASGSGSGTAGDIDVTARSVFVNNQGKITAQTLSSAGGNIRLQDLNSLTLNNNSEVSASTGDGQGGTIDVNASDSVSLSRGGGLFARATGNGSAGSLKITTNQLTLQNGSQATVSSTGSGSAGNLNITATSVGLDNQAKLSAETVSAVGGNINLQGLSSLTLSNNSEVSASTGDGQGGNVEVNASDVVNLSSGSGVFARATGKGSAGSLRITANQLAIQDGAQASVSNTGSGSTGNLEVKARSLFMNNQGNLTARTESGEGGNIRIQVAETILLRNNSNILTEALGTGNGGDITINASGFVLAILPENSDIAATAIQGRGGNISVTAQGVFGFSLPERLVRTPDSDISAASQLGINGTREIDTGNQPQPEALPDEPLPELIEPRCQVGRRQANSEFIISGRGGLPPNPSQTLSSNTGWVDLRSSTTGTENTSSSALPMKPTSSAPTQFVEAQGWIVNYKGEVELTTSAPSATLYSSWQTPKACPTQNENVEK